jgi:hypothetical protein
MATFRDMGGVDGRTCGGYADPRQPSVLMLSAGPGAS